MNRIRWFQAQLPVSLRAMAERLGAAPLVIDGDMGFKVARIRQDSIQANYYERFAWTESGIDPFGREFSFERESYKTIRFVLSKKYPELEIIDAPRGLASLFSRFAELTDFGLSIQPLRVDVLQWAQALQANFDGTFRIASMSVTDLGVEESITGTLTVSSRSEDVRAAATKLLSRRQYTTQKVQIALRSRASTALLTLTSDGGVKSSLELDSEIVDAVRQAFPQQGSREEPS